MRKNVLFLVFLLLSFVNAQNSKITGKVIDVKTGQSLIGANVLVLQLDNRGAASNENGQFEINVPVGSYSIKVSLLGYKTTVKTDVIVRSGRDAYVLVKLSESALELDQVTVTADYFDKSIIENNLSAMGLEAEEIKRSPGSMQDFQRILQGMAGVSFSNDQNNELLVRGGAPNENLTVLDGMEIHSTNHYPNEFNSGGPINMINTDLIQDIKFSTGGFISKYGDKLSSVMSIETREGTRLHGFNSNINMSMAGAGAVMEGHLGEKGSWIFSARKSYIDLIAGSVGLTAVPRYYDAQFKVAYELSNRHKLSWSGIYGNDKIDIEGESDKTREQFANKTDSIEVGSVDVKQYQYATGFSLRSMWNKNFYSLINFSVNKYHSKVNVTGDFTQRVFDENGKVISNDIISKRNIFSTDGYNSEIALKSEFVWDLSDWNEINFGGSVKTARYFADQIIDSDSARFDINGDGVFDKIITQPNSLIDYKIDFMDHSKFYFFINEKLNFFNDRLKMNVGLRYDYFSYSEKGNISPRFSFSYYLVPQLTSLNFSYGEFYQTQGYPVYGDRYQTDINRYLKNTHSRHFVLGLEHIISDGLRLTVEGYYKSYDNIPIREDFLHFYDRQFRSEKLLNVGKKNVYGIDLFIQQKLVKDIYGTISFSRMWNKMDDLRIGYEGDTYSSDYDFPYVFNLIVGKKFTNLRSDLDNMPAIIKYITYLLPFSDDMEISLKWRYASGKPYTPKEYITHEQHKAGGKWTEGTWIPTTNINGANYPDYHRLDIAISSRYNFDSWSMSVYLSIQNLYNRKNIAMYQYNSDGTIDEVGQFAFLPVGGFEIEF